MSCVLGAMRAVLRPLHSVAWQSESEARVTERDPPKPVQEALRLAASQLGQLEGWPQGASEQRDCLAAELLREALRLWRERQPPRSLEVRLWGAEPVWLEVTHQGFARLRRALLGLWRDLELATAPRHVTAQMFTERGSEGAQLRLLFSVTVPERVVERQRWGGWLAPDEVTLLLPLPLADLRLQAGKVLEARPGGFRAGRGRARLPASGRVLLLSPAPALAGYYRSVLGAAGLRLSWVRDTGAAREWLARQVQCEQMAPVLFDGDSFDHPELPLRALAQADPGIGRYLWFLTDRLTQPALRVSGGSVEQLPRWLSAEEVLRRIGNMCAET